MVPHTDGICRRLHPEAIGGSFSWRGFEGGSAMDERPEGWTRGEAPGKEDSFLQQELQRTGERADNPCRASKHNGSSLSNNCAAGRQQEEMPSVVTPHSLAPPEPRAISPSSTAIVWSRPGMLPVSTALPVRATKNPATSDPATHDGTGAARGAEPEFQRFLDRACLHTGHATRAFVAPDSAGLVHVDAHGTGFGAEPAVDA